MNPLLPEPANNLGRNISFATKAGAKMDSEDSSRFQDTLQANASKQKSTNAGRADDNSNRFNATPDSAVKQTQPAVEGGRASLNAESSVEGEFSLESETNSLSNSSPTEAQLFSEQLLPAQLLAVEPGQTEAAANDAALELATTSLLQTDPATQILPTPDVSDLGIQVDSALHHPLGTVPDHLAPPVTIDSGHSSEILADAIPTLGGAADARTRGMDAAANIMAKPGSNPALTETEKPFAPPNADLNIADTSADKKNLLGKPAGSVTNFNISLPIQPGYLKSNLDWQFANQMPALESDGAVDFSSLSKGSSSAIGTAYAAVSSVAAMQTADAFADHRMQMPVNIKFGQPEWAGMVAERTAMMAAQKISFAELQLDPPELGPLQVKVTVQNDQASVSFVSANPAVRDSLEQTSARLREMLEQQGVDLLDVNVADQSDRQQNNSGDSHPSTRDIIHGEDDNLTDGTVNLMTVVTSGIDHYV